MPDHQLTVAQQSERATERTYQAKTSFQGRVKQLVRQRDDARVEAEHLRRQLAQRDAETTQALKFADEVIRKYKVALAGSRHGR